MYGCTDNGRTGAKHNGCRHSLNGRGIKILLLKLLKFVLAETGHNSKDSEVHFECLVLNIHCVSFIYYNVLPNYLLQQGAYGYNLKNFSIDEWHFHIILVTMANGISCKYACCTPLSFFKKMLCSFSGYLWTSPSILESFRTTGQDIWQTGASEFRNILHDSTVVSTENEESVLEASDV